MIAHSFQATLFDTAFNPVLFAGDPLLFPAFFSVDNDGTEFFNSATVSIEDVGGGTRRVTLDVSELAPQVLMLEFLALGSDDGLQITIRVDNVELPTSSRPGIVPEPASLLIVQLFALVGALTTRRTS